MLSDRVTGFKVLFVSLASSYLLTRFQSLLFSSNPVEDNDFLQRSQI